MPSPPSPSPAPTAAAHAEALRSYARQGSRRARRLGIRGPLRYDARGRLHGEILEAYQRHGCYVFEGLVDPAEIDDLRQGVDELLARAPTGPGAKVDAAGRPAFGVDFARSPFLFIKPLSDPWGGTDLLGGRHPTKMTEPRTDDDAPDAVIHIISAVCQSMPAGLRLYGHPDLLAVAAAINGDDFVPYNDATFVKLPGLGGSVSWHQDGVTHWQSPRWDQGIHGFNFQVQLYRCTAANALWVVPGTHKLGRIDIPRRVADNGGSDHLPDAVPLECEPGDVTIVNRQTLHASFANTSPDPRISITFGFHRRSSVLGAHGALGQPGDVVYDAERIFQRASVIALAIDARAQHYPAQQRYVYAPFAGREAQFRYTAENAQRYLKDYYLKDLAI